MPTNVPPSRLVRLVGWAIAIVLAQAPTFALLRAAESVRERIPFNADWRFTQGDPDGAAAELSYEKLKPWLLAATADFGSPGETPPVRPEGNPGASVAYVQPNFDDGAWRKLALPHDWGIEGPFDQDHPGETGKLPWWGVGWYRKSFDVPAGDRAKRVHLDVDGAMSYAAVWLNGHFVGGWPYGYNSWRVDLTPFLKPGEKNVLAIRLDNPRDSSRWYPGGGIYRNVWLVKTAPVHLAHGGTFVHTPAVSRESATVEIRATVENSTSAAAGNLQVSSVIYALDEHGAKVGPALASGPRTSVARSPAGRQALVVQSLALPQPRLWSPQMPQRYVAVATLTQNGEAIDVYETPFGVRTIAVDAARGFVLNGERLPLRGVCNHHDLGALGAAINVRALERQLEILREMGCNAIRTSHNPPAPELLELCDRMGFLVIDEAFDTWRRQKKRNDYNRLFPEWHERDLRAWVRRDRNHPSVVLWSIGNEVVEQSDPDGWKLAAHLAAIVREEDRTRPITAGFNIVNAAYSGFQTTVDFFGYNYKPTEYARLRASMPHLPIYSSESASTVSTRGEYFFPVSDNKLEGKANFQMSSYDLYAPRWAWPPDVEFKGLDENPFTGGEFVWTGFDYLGEPTPYNTDATNLLNFTDPAQQERIARELAELKKIRVPSRSSYFGIIDLAGFKKDRFYLYQARWRPELPMAHILPHWNWPERVGQVTPVHIYSSGDEAELFLNGQSLGRKKRGPYEYRFRWDDVVYAPGELRVVTFKNSVRWAEATTRTTGAASKVTLAADRAELRADGSDLAFVTLTLADENGLAVPRTNRRVKFELAGPGELIATDNGDPTDHTSFQSPERNAFNGLALAIVRTRAGEPGAITLRATSEGLAPAEVALRSR